MTDTTGRDPRVRDRILGLLSKKRDYRRELKELAGRHEFVVFYGAGVVLDRLLGPWNRYIGRKADYCCDSDRAKWGKYFSGLKCLSPDELLAMKDKCAVFVALGDSGPVFEYLRKNGVASARQVYKYDLAAGAIPGTYTAEEACRGLCEVYGQLADGRSLKVFDAVVDRVLDPGARTGIMAEVREENQYFPPDLISLSRHENFVDAGAFDGDSVREIVSRTKGEFDRIFSFELDPANFAALEKTIRLLPERDRIKAFNLGLWDSAGGIAYDAGNTDSAIGEGASSGRVVPLDAALKDEKVTFIKMDIEGAEPRALRGARNIIRAQKPRLAVCTYHDFRHLWEVPLYIKELVPEYKLYLRHHSSLEYETVCYAVP